MADDPRVRQLLDEIFDSERTPEEVCSSFPELLPEVRKRWQKMRHVEAKLEALFPKGPAAVADSAPRPSQGANLPHIPGYEVEGVLGRGGMGVVLKARQVRLNRPVALKMLLAGGCAGPHELARFQREAEAVAALRHANIVQVYDVGDHEGWPYFTMEFVEGGSLAQKLAGVPQPAHQAATLAATLAQAVHAAHQGGIVHRDLKPANVLLTADGTPKITDFGLARRLEGGAGLTQSGETLGTPSYMAPEQAQGKTPVVGPAVDIYALGTILYELLTGRPPFRAETAVETIRQSISQDPVPPSRLNAKVPRDLETICLKCLHKDPARRYATAAALAEDLYRFQRGEPIAARPAGVLERISKWVRRRPTHAAMLAAGLLLAAALVGVSLYLVVQRSHQRDTVGSDLREVVALQEQARWVEARAVLERAEARLDGGGPADLREQLGRARRDLDLVTQLDAIRLKRATRGELAFYKARADQEYAEAFQEAGLGKVLDPLLDVTATISASAVREALIAALDDWAVCAADKERRDWLLEVARRVDPDSEGWRERILDPAMWDDRQTLNELARTVPVAGQSVSLLLALGERLWLADEDAIPFLKRVQKAHPADFWANLILGNALLQRAPKDASGYYRAALASRPGAAVGYCAVGDALRLQNELDEAIYYYQMALDRDPSYARANNNLGLALAGQGRLDEAIDYHRKTLKLDPDYAWPHLDLGNVLRVKGRVNEAYDQYREVLRLDPKNREVQDGLRTVLIQLGRGQEAQASWRKILDANPPEHRVWSGYAELCLFLGMKEEYCRARRDLLDRFGAKTEASIAEPVSRACLLLRAPEDELRRAAALADSAVSAKGSVPLWVYRYYLFAQGLAEYRQGHLDSAITLMEGEASVAMGPAPHLVLAMAQHRLGQEEQARKTLAAAIFAFDWNAAQADSRDVWIVHILRREAEAMILPNLPAFLKGEYEPRDNVERMALLGACQFHGLHGAAARLYADVFAADPDLAIDLIKQCLSRAARGDRYPTGLLEDLNTECRFPAARCAALAGYGLGKDGSKLSEAERTRWRKQARDWLQADLAVWAKALDGGSGATRVRAKKILTQWQDDPDLAGLREPSAIDKLSVDERKECLALWEEVAAVLHRAEKLK
jgi:serine/threonine-protein kinase